MESLFLLEHVRSVGNGAEDRKRIGIYSSEPDAHEAIDRLRTQDGFSDYPDGFTIQRFEIDEDHWTDGYSE
ncbi:hypothetical protein [Nocardia sp. NBC_01377]|uniref:DUF7336 domain-containing protein n=1 Tax=Nocardia sp. NBC_01377 TaxID=2903595 RepID=UPI00386CA426